MKKVVTILLLGVFLITGVGSAVAEESAPNSGTWEKQKAELLGKGQVKLEVRKEFVDEMHTINNLRMERNALQNQVIENQDMIMDLYVAARESGNKEALQQAQEIRGQIKDVNSEIREIRQQINEAWKTFREEVKEGNSEAAQTAIDKIISLGTLANEKVKEKITFLTAIVEELS
ncbi:MAG: hypothetical protein ACOWWO_19530 [Peptococcaceae bacterium]